jgi:hypothetical protein
MDMKIRKMIFLGIMISISIVVSIVEAQISTVLFIIPGVKLGLANIVTLIILYIYGKKDAFLVLILRILIVALIYSGDASSTFEPCGGIMRVWSDDPIPAVQESFHYLGVGRWRFDAHGRPNPDGNSDSKDRTLDSVFTLYANLKRPDGNLYRYRRQKTDASLRKDAANERKLKRAS